jgi:hypothetical protein
MKGKYATKAINRAAATDNQVIADLRQKLEQSDRENSGLRGRVAVLNAKLSRSVTREAAKLAQQEVQSLRSEVSEQRDLFRAYLEALAFDLFDLYAKHNCRVGEGESADKFNEEYARLFHMSDRYGELIDYMSTLPNRDSQAAINRRNRRATNTLKKVRATRAWLVDQHRNPGAFRKAEPLDGLTQGRVSVYPEDLGMPR